MYVTIYVAAGVVSFWQIKKYCKYVLHTTYLALNFVVLWLWTKMPQTGIIWLKQALSSTSTVGWNFFQDCNALLCLNLKEFVIVSRFLEILGRIYNRLFSRSYSILKSRIIIISLIFFYIKSSPLCSIRGSLTSLSAHGKWNDGHFS